jgi:hypothetical protein
MTRKRFHSKLKKQYNILMTNTENFQPNPDLIRENNEENASNFWREKPKKRVKPPQHFLPNPNQIPEERLAESIVRRGLTPQEINDDPAMATLSGFFLDLQNDDELRQARQQNKRRKPKDSTQTQNLPTKPTESDSGQTRVDVKPSTAPLQEPHSQLTMFAAKSNPTYDLTLETAHLNPDGSRKKK